jgi:hypothetical protein
MLEVLRSCRTKKKEHLIDEYESQGYKNSVELAWNLLLAERSVDDRKGRTGVILKRVSAVRAVGRCGPGRSQMGPKAQGM